MFGNTQSTNTFDPIDPIDPIDVIAMWKCPQCGFLFQPFDGTSWSANRDGDPGEPEIGRRIRSNG